MVTTFEKIEKFLDDNHMSRRKLAITAGIPPTTLQSAMSRNKKISFDLLVPIAEIMGITVQELADDVEMADNAKIAVDLLLGEPGVRLGEKISSQGGAWELIADENGIFYISNMDGISATLSPDAAEMLNAEIDRFIDFRLREFCSRKDDKSV